MKEKEKKLTPKKSKKRMLLVILFVAIFAITSYISLKGSYLEFQELGSNYIDVFWTNMKYKYYILAANFVILYFIIYQVNKGIKKGLKVFFDQEKKEMPKLLNKSLALVISSIVSVAISFILTPKIILFASNVSFGINDPIFNMDISYYMFIKPVIEIFIVYLMALIVGLSVYMALYYVIVFNIYFDGIDRTTLKESKLVKKLSRNVIIIAILIGGMTILNTQNILFQKFLTLEDGTELIGAGFIEATIKLWLYTFFAFIIVISIWNAVKHFRKSETKKVFKWLLTMPIYLVVMFIIIVLFDVVFINSNELDKEKTYITYNIDATKQAYGIDIDEINVNYTGTITENEVDENKDVTNNITIINKDAVLKTLQDSQTESGYYTFRNANIAKYNISGEEKVVYISPREITNNSTTYNNKTYEFTHGYGEIITSASDVTDTGNIQYIQRIESDENIINITQPRIYFGLETNNTIITNTKNKTEYDYTDENAKEYTYSYNGKAGLQLNFIDRLILGMRKGDLNIALSGNVTADSKILINRNIIERAKKVLPYLMYDENPYTVIDDNGNIIWVLDAYTISDAYPYSTYTTIIHENSKEKINYIRNSVKVLINAYDGTMKFYVTDRTDPIAMAYRNTYPTLFENIDTQIAQDISKNFIYSEYLYDIQSKMLKIYHNVKPDVLYRNNDIWDFATYNSTQTTKSTGNKLEPYYTMLKTSDSDNSELGLIQMYTPEDKQNIISYLVGSYENGHSKLKIYKFSSDSNIFGPMQLNKQIEQDETISSELSTLNVTGTKITKQMIIVPIENTLLYIEPVYQTMLNESNIPLLKKVIVASGSKVAIGNNLQEALKNLLSRYAVNIEVENTDDIEGLIKAIIKANNNLIESNTNNDWSMMGEDLENLQELIKSLEKIKEEDEKNILDTVNQVNTIDENVLNNNSISNTNVTVN